jgi:hypothetical protein
MKYKALFNLLKKAIEYKRSHKIVEEIIDLSKDDKNTPLKKSK